MQAQGGHLGHLVGDGTFSDISTTFGADNPYIREKQSGTSYLSSPQPWIHFGLGVATQVNRLTVRWPSGLSTILTSIAGGQLSTIEEPSEASIEPGEQMTTLVNWDGENKHGEAMAAKVYGVRVMRDGRMIDSARIIRVK